MNVEQQLLTRNDKLSPMTVVELLRAFAQRNETFNAVAQAFAMRERTRSQITVHSLKQFMDKDGHKYTREQYEEVLKFLASMKLGVLIRNSRDKVVAIKEVNTTLQSIGLAAISKTDALQRASFKLRQAKLPVNTPTVKRQMVKADQGLKKPIKELKLEMKLGHREFIFDLFPEAKFSEVLDIIEKIYRHKDMIG